MSTQSNTQEEPRSVSLLLHCPLRLGIAADLTQFIYKNHGRILYHDQYVDPETRHYYTCLQWEISEFLIGDAEMKERLSAFIGNEPDTEWSLHYSDKALRMAIFVSKDPSCLYDLLARTYSGEWKAEVPVIVSNHQDLEGAAARFGVEFRAFPVTKENKDQVEAAQLDLLESHRIDLVLRMNAWKSAKPPHLTSDPARS